MNYPIRTLHQLRPLLVGLRKKAGLSQVALAAQLGITQQSYAKIEANPTATSVERLHTIFRILGGELQLVTDEADVQSAALKRRKEVKSAPAPAALKPANEERW